jgi:hypothetical protein
VLPSPEDLEQERAFLAGLAPVAASYFDALCEQGLGRAEALELAADWQSEFLRGVYGIAAADSGPQPP